jgi:redox-regulated HSP33 family molecular chaperone
METTNLKSIDNLLVKVQGEGKVKPKEISDSHYKATLKSYIMNLKTRYTKNQTQVREMNDLQYYVWILRHEKRKN